MNIRFFARIVLNKLRHAFRTFRLPSWFWEDFKKYNEGSKLRLITKPAEVRNLFPIIDNRTSSVDFDPHYVYHIGWAARILAENRPNNHVDFSSLSHFVTVCSAFLPIKHYDFRRPEFVFDGLDVGTADLTNLSFEDGALPSVSCMHVVEHIGLGRYGDNVDPEGDWKAIRELQRVTAVGGQLLFVVPVGKERVMFNAHRVYAYDTIVRAFEQMEIQEFSLISLRGTPRLIRNADPSLVQNEEYGCGCFLFTKKAGQ